jgi:hypothetical protein
MAKLSPEALLETQRKYLTDEIAKHERDIQTNQGKVQENNELLERINNTCLYCGERVMNWGRDEGEPTRMESHIDDRHHEDWLELVKEGRMGTLEEQALAQID